MFSFSKYRIGNHSGLEICFVTLVIAAGVALRAINLDFNPFWVDEAESSINALTILEKGYPSDSYLGLPIYENTLIRLWPGNMEYEFRDISYSDRHLAIYHGWLPLYSIAASFALYGIVPDQPGNSFRVKHNLDDRRRRTRAARVPGIVFGAVFLGLAFVGGTMLYGRDAGWAALLIASIHPWHFYISRQARYYSAEVTITTACCLLLWSMIMSGKWRHFVLGGLAFVLLFHTHLLSFFSAAVVFLLFAPLVIRNHPLGIRKLAVFALIVAAGSIPWIVVTGFLSEQDHIPRAWPLLRFPSDLAIYPPAKILSLITGILFASFIVWLLLTKRKVSGRWEDPLLASSPAFIFLTTWVVCGYLSFLLFMPAASFYLSRLNMSYWGPGVLLGAVTCAAIARALTPRFAILAAPALFLAFSLFTGSYPKFPLQNPDSNPAWANDEQLYSELSGIRIARGTKLYAAPPNHLILTFYTGLPFQSIAPIRKQFLDQYRGDVLFIDSAYSSVDGSPPPDPELIRKAALQSGQQLNEQSAERWSLLLFTRDYREMMRNTLAGGKSCALEKLPAFAQRILEERRKRVYYRAFLASSQELMTRGFNLYTWHDWRAVQVYRFVDPDSRRGIRSNFAQRLRGAHALLLVRADKVIYQSSWHPARAEGGAEFEIRP
jgi:hypothetical protein